MELISPHYWWPSLSRDVKDYCNLCLSLILSGLTLSWTLLLNWLLLQTGGPVLQDGTFCPITWSTIYTSPGDPFHQLHFQSVSFPQCIILDRGVQLTSRFCNTLCALLDIKLYLPSAYHPQNNEQVKHVNQVLGNYLCNLVSSQQDDWVNLRPWA